AAFSGLDRLRRRLAIAWAALAAALVGGGALFAVVFYRRLIQPIRIVADAAAEPDLPARVPETLPGEFAALARRFNAMGERIATEQGRTVKQLSPEASAEFDALHQGLTGRWLEEVAGKGIDGDALLASALDAMKAHTA
ncbi:MAG: HAMP domain-containing protein, partial [Pseudomonadota bacterium]